jgi:hypothetical protein
LAQRLGIPFQYTADGEARWIDKQGESPERSFVMSWQCWWWAADGIAHFEKGDYEIYAASINDAFDATVKYVDNLIDPAGILVECEVRDPVTHDWSAPQNPRRCLSYRWEIANDPKAGCRNGGKPSQTLREIRAKEMDLSTLNLMQNVAGAFGFKMRDLALVEGWANGKISPEKLDEWLEPLIRGNEWQWGMVLQLRDQLLDGKRIAPALHEYCVRRESFGHLEIHDLVFAAFAYNQYNDEDPFTHHTYRNAVDEWLSRDDRAADEQLDEALAPLKQHLLASVKKDGLGRSGVFQTSFS